MSHSELRVLTLSVASMIARKGVVTRMPWWVVISAPGMAAAEWPDWARRVISRTPQPTLLETVCTR